MSYDKNDVVKVATKLGRLVNGGVVGYYAGGKTSEVMREAIPEQLIDVVERHKKIQLGASLAQSFVPAAGLAASAALVASLWKMYYDINQVLGIKISENAGKSLTSAILTNLSSFAAQGVATTVSEGVKLIPLVGWIASAGITSVTSTAIVYGSAYLYMNALSAMYSAKGTFDLDYLTSEISDEHKVSSSVKTVYNSSYEKYTKTTALAKIQKCSDCGRTVSTNMSIKEADLFTYRLQGELSRSGCQLTSDEIRNSGTVGNLINLIIARQK